MTPAFAPLAFPGRFRLGLEQPLAHQAQPGDLRLGVQFKQGKLDVSWVPGLGGGGRVAAMVMAVCANRESIFRQRSAVQCVMLRVDS